MTECIIRLSSNQVSFEKGVKRMDCTIISLVELSDKALETIRSSDKGPLQTEMKKILGRESRTCSKAIQELEKSRITKREKVAIRNSRTYLIRALEKNALWKGPREFLKGKKQRSSRKMKRPTTMAPRLAGAISIIT